MTKTRFSKKYLPLLLAIIMVFETLIPCLPVFAAESYMYEGGAGTVVSDLDTTTKYSESLGDNASTEYSGRIWTDKSVYTDDATIVTFGGGTSTIKLNENNNGEDFLVAYSALATSQSVSGQTHAPVDVVFIIDISGSMSNSYSEMDNGLSRIANTVTAVNASIEKLMSMNEYTRVAVVTFSSTAEILLPLDYYTKVTENNTTYNYLSLNSTSAGGNIDLTVRARGTDGTVNKTRDVSGGTNIQAGLYTGMNILATSESVTADVNGQKVQRIPSVVLLSDGAPTYSSGSNNNSQSNWWAPLNNDNDGNGSDCYYGNGFKALMTGAYMKNAIDTQYKVSGTNYDTTFYTIGMGVSELDNYESGFFGGSSYTGEKDLAQFTLYPKSYWDSTNDMAEDIVDAWTRYTNQTPGGTSTISVQVGSNENYTVRHPQSPLNDIYTTADKDALKNLVDSYYDADNASAVANVFDQIVANISISAPQVPTEIKGTDHTTDGYITYTDPIGEYMEVKDVKAILYAGHTYTEKSKATNGNITTYTFSGTVDSAVYGHQDLDDIIITVAETDGKQTLVVKIPASVIPLRINTVELNSDGSVKTHINNGAFPARVVYSVGLQSEVVKKSNDGVIYINKSKISAEYLEKNTNSDGTINFYSNVYTNSYTVNGAAAGDATVEFEPSHSNGFYYILEDMPIYKDAEFKNQVTASEGLSDTATYYYRTEYYHGSSVEVEAVERTGAQLKKTSIKTGTDGYLYREAGSPRLNRVLLFEGTKIYNNTNTAEDFYAPEFHYADGSTNAYDGKFIVHLGNNGLLTAVAGGDLQISKSVNAGVGLTAPDSTFVFTLDLDGADVNQGTYDYVIVDADGNQVSKGTVSASSTTIRLKDGQAATVYALPPGTEYTVTEKNESGFAQQSEGATGTISAGETSVAVFTNTYNVTPVEYPTNGELSGTKVLEGRTWNADDEFTFFISPYNNAPLPEDYDAVNGVTVTESDAVNGSATFEFGTIEFTAPGVYRYTVYEKEPENNEYLPGMSYSRALYRIVVTVEDNGSGTLSVTDSDVQKLYEDDATPLFTYNSNNEIVLNEGQESEDAIVFVNTYSVDDVTRTPVALKNYTDNSGEKPLVSGMFEFELKALGIVENDQIVDSDISKVPMPEGSVNGVITTENEGHNITFPSVTFTQQSLIDMGVTSITYRYQMREVVPDNKVNGMKYDESVYTIDVTVSIDGSSRLNVNAVYPGDQRIVTFNNTYTPDPVEVDINGTKVFNGRDMVSGESFEFVLGSNAATGNAIRNGVVTVPSSVKTVTGAKDGVASGFSFDNIRFTKSGTYEFTVSETKGTSAAIEYDDSVITVTVVIEDTGNNGDLNVKSVTYSNGKNAAEFENNYTTEFTGTPVTIEGTKNLTGKTLLEGEFYFNVEERYNGTKISEGLVTHTEDTVADENGIYSGKITFVDNKIYDKAGTYEYIITEQIPDDQVHGTDYDESRYRVKVTVTDDNNGNLTADVSGYEIYDTQSASWKSANDIVFANDYNPDDATVVLPLIKKVIDGDRSKPLEAGEFKFELKVVSAEHTHGIILPATTTVSNAENGNIIFDEIILTKPGTYVVSVQEVVPDDADKIAGITYSTQTLTAVYNVVDDRIGQLTATLVQFIGGENIVNLYKAEPTDVTIDITKTFTGRVNDEWLSTDEFDFEVKVTDADTLTAIENGDIEFTFDTGSTNTATYTISTKGGKATANVKVNKAGTYKFTVSEVDGGIEGVTYDTLAKEVVIIAQDDSKNAKIKVTVNGQDTDTATLNFTNTYKSAESAPIEITGTKNVTSTTGNTYTLKGGEFTFVITGSANAPMPQKTSVQNAANGKIDFGTVKFTERGVYTYTVRESQTGGAPTGFTFDGSVYTVTVTATDDYANAKLVTAVKIEDQDDNEEPIVFTNTYDPKQTSAVIFGGKELDSEHKVLEKDEFSFTIKAVTDGAPMPAEDTVGNDATGLFQFGAIAFTKVGEYKYEITENDLGKYGYTYDDTVYTVTVNVTDGNGSGKLSAVVDLGTVADPKVNFVNEYAPEPTETVIGAKGELQKTLEGREIKAEEFIFAVLDSDNKELYTAKNDKDGEFKFTLKFTKAGTYNYKLVEKDNGVAGVTYDKNTYNVEIKVSDNNGKLKVDSVVYTLENKAVEEVVFSNTYKADGTDVTISALKKLTGRELKDGEFKFVLKDADGNIVATATNTKDGKIVFDKLVISEVGAYKYTVYEEVGTQRYVTYDKTEFVVDFIVTDGGNGKLLASTPVIKKTGSDSAVAEITFENTYTVPNAPEVPQTGHKTKLALWFTLLFMSGAGLVATTVYGKNRKEAEEE